MKLSNYVRDAFIEAIMKDVPEVDYHSEAARVFTAAYLDTLPKEVQMAWVLPACRPYLNVAYVFLCGTSVQVPKDSTYGRSDIGTPAKVKAKIEELSQSYKQQCDNRAALRYKVKGATYSCNTTKQLRELLPEFDKYLPPEQEKTARTLPVVQNIVADFVKAGWPKGGKKCL